MGSQVSAFPAVFTLIWVLVIFQVHWTDVLGLNELWLASPNVCQICSWCQGAVPYIKVDIWKLFNLDTYCSACRVIINVQSKVLIYTEVLVL